MPYPVTTPASMVTFFQDAGLKPAADAHINELFLACQYVAKMAERIRPHGTHEVEPSSMFSATGVDAVAALQGKGTAA
jgi:hypothetical protein